MHVGHVASEPAATMRCRFVRRAIALLAVSLVAIGSVPPFAHAQEIQETTELNEEGPVVEVRLEPPLPGEDPWQRVGLRPGEHLDAHRARQALRTALASGTFAEARATLRRRQEGLVLVIAGERRVRVREVAFRGVNARRIEAVQSDFGITEGDRISEDDLRRAVERLQQGYQSSGWASARVIAQWRLTDDPGTRVLMVTVIEGPVTRVRNIEVPGVPGEIATLVREASQIRPGDIADPQALFRAMEPIAIQLRRARYLSAWIEQVYFVPVVGRPPDDPRVDVVVRVRLGPRYVLQWVGLTRFRADAIERQLRLEEERSIDVATLSVLANRVRDFYVRRGFLDAQVEVTVHAQDPDHRVLRFFVRQGERVLVRSVHFPGASHIGPEVLEGILRDVLEAELPGGSMLEEPGEHEQFALDGSSGDDRERFRLQPTRTYVPELYAEAARRMVARYREHGFLDATVSSPQVRRIRTEGGRPALEVTFQVREGPRTMFEEVFFEGNHSVPSRQLAEQTGLRLGVPLSYADIDSARTRLIEHYRELGHLFVRVEPEIDRSPDRAVARVRFVIHEGPQVRVGRVLFRGSERTQRWLLEDRVALRPGELYRPSLVRATQRRLGELGIFAGVTITPVEPEVEAPVKDVIIQLTELRSYFEVRGGLSTGEGIRVGMEYVARNISGTGVTFSFAPQIGYQIFPLGDPVFQRNFDQLSIGGRLRRRLPVSFQFPAIPGLGPAWRASVDLAHARIVERQFAIDTFISGAFSVIWRPMQQFSLTLTPAELQSNGLELLGAESIEQVLRSSPPGDVERLRRLLLLPEGITNLFASRFTAAMDYRDQVFNPQSGWYLSLTGEFVATLFFEPRRGGGLAPEPGNTLRGIASLSGYVPFSLPFGNVVLASTFRGGVNYNLERCKVTYTNRQFFLGGAETMRGWLQDTLIPQDVFDNLRPACATGRDDANGSPDSGQVAVPLTQRGGDVFVTWRNELRIPIGASGWVVGLFLDVGNLWKELRNVDLVKLRAAAGAGLRYVTPIGPVGVDLGFNLSPRVIVPAMLDTPAQTELPWAVNLSIGSF